MNRRLVARTCGSVTAAALVVAAAAAPALTAGRPGEPVVHASAADMTKAHAALIRGSDLKSWFHPDPQDEASPGVPRCPGFYAPDRSSLVVTGRASASFRDSGGDEIGSKVLLLRTHAEAERYWRATVRPRYIDCLARTFTSHVPTGITGSIIRAVGVRVSSAGVDRIEGFRAYLHYRRGKSLAERDNVTFVRTVVFLQEGRSIGTLQIVGAEQVCDCVDGLAGRLGRRLIDISRG